MSGLALHDRGAGPAVVLLHSGGMSSRQWRALADLLQPHHRVLAPDLPGCGANPPWPHDAPFVVQQDLDALLAALPPDLPLHLVGHSYGGLLALRMALQEPARVRSVAVYEPTAFGVLRTPPDAEALADLVALTQQPVFIDEATGGSEPWMRLFIDYWNGPGGWDRLPEPTRAGFLRVGRKVFREVRALMDDATTQAQYAQLRAPTLLLSGEHTTPAERCVMTRLAQALPHNSRRIVAGAGHMGPLSHAAEVNAAIVAHLGQHPF